MSGTAPSVRVSELLLSLSLAIDLGLGLPMETMLRTAIVAHRLARAAGFSDADTAAAYYLAMLRFVGCTTSSHHDAELFGDELGAASLLSADDAQMLGAVRRAIGPGEPVHKRAAMFGKAVGFALSGGLAAQHRMHCEAAAIIAERLQMPPEVRTGIVQVYDRWDGRGSTGLTGEAIGRPMRAVHIAQLAAILSRTLPPANIGAEVRARAGRQFDPALAEIFAANSDGLLEGLAAENLTDVLYALEPPAEPLAGPSLDRALEAVADFGDLKTPHMLGHSRRVAALAADAASRMSLPAADIDLIRRAGLVHDIGRIGVPEKLWIKTGPLTPAEQERVRLHTYLTERIFAATPSLGEIGRIGGGHHERLDGSGYHRGTGRSLQPGAMRLLAAANTWCALTEPRPHRPILTAAEATQALNIDAKAGRLDLNAVEAVLSAAGATPSRRRAANISLSEREIEVLRLVAGQHSNKAIARTLGISPKTVERHVTHIYDKIGATTRAGAALYATDNGLI